MQPDILSVQAINDDSNIKEGPGTGAADFIIDQVSIDDTPEKYKQRNYTQILVRKKSPLLQGVNDPELTPKKPEDLTDEV